MTRVHGLSRAASLLAVTLPATLLLMACGGTDEPQSATAPDFGCQLPAGPVVIAGTARSNMPAAPPTGGAVRALDRAIEAGAWVAVYDADSVPDRKAGASSKSDAQNPEAKKADTARFRQGARPACCRKGPRQRAGGRPPDRARRRRLRRPRARKRHRHRGLGRQRSANVRRPAVPVRQPPARLRCRRRRLAARPRTSCPTCPA